MKQSITPAPLLTPLQQSRKSRNASIAAEYRALSRDPGNAKTSIIRHLMKKYGIYTRSTVYAILRSESVRIGKEAAL